MEDVMKKKIVSCVLIISLLLYVGCYNSETLTKQELTAMDREAAITVFTKEQRRIVFEAGKYSLIGDTLWGMGAENVALSINKPFRGPIPLSHIVVIEVKEFSAVKTMVFVGGVGLAVAGLIAAANSSSKSSPPPPPPSGGTKFSCPFIYTFDGSEYHFESETFAGAVFKGIERSTFDVLNYLKPVSGVCRLKLVNAREETEYVDEFKLLAIDHPFGTRVIPDSRGIVHTISTPMQPNKCVDLKGADVLATIIEKDGAYWQSDLAGRNWTDEHELRDGLVMEFPRPPAATSVKLIVNGKNTRLGYFALAKIFQMKGNDKLAWYTQLESNPVERTKFSRWLMREGMLHIHLWQNGTWVEKAAVPDVGPGIAKDQVAVLDISDIPDSVLRVRVDCTTDLWRIDHICADYSRDRAVTSVELPLRSGINERGSDIANLLQHPDAQYYVTVSDQYADIEFADIPHQSGMQRSYIAKTRGFYYQWLNSDGSAQHDLVERILTEPKFGTKFLMPQWMKERAEYEGIAVTE